MESGWEETRLWPWKVSRPGILGRIWELETLLVCQACFYLHYPNDVGNPGQEIQTKIHLGPLKAYSPRVPEESNVKPLGDVIFTI